MSWVMNRPAFIYGATARTLLGADKARIVSIIIWKVYSFKQL